mgnify:CR=1 FL=1
MPAKKKIARTRRVRPKNLREREELIEYLERNCDIELPFLEELWNVCVEKAINDAEQTQYYTNVETGEQVKRKGFWSDNPVSWYFKMANMNGWKQKAVAKREGIVEQLSESKKVIADVYTDGNIQDTNEIIDWINLFESHERAYLMKRYTYYFDVYEINEGADRVLLKRILSYEIALHRIDLKRASRQQVNIQEELKLSDALNSCLESMKWTKKQRNAREDMAQNKFTVWLDSMAKEGEFKPTPHTYPKDEVDFLLETYIDSAREMMS